MKKLVHRTDVIYYWYDRGELRKNGDAEIAMNAILNHDFDTFMKLREKYPPDPDGEFIYFPDHASVYDSETEEIIDQIDVTIPENFNKIDDTDYEWG